MDKSQFGEICASLRKDMFNPVVGRMWSQEDLANASNLSIKLVGQIERGEKVKLYGDILEALAIAFQLTSAERARFFAMANDVDRENLSREEQSISIVVTNVLRGLENIKQPVLLHDGLYRIIGLNSAYRKVYGLTQEYLNSIPDDDPTKYHIVRHIHDPKSPVRSAYHSQLQAVEMNNAIYWRFLSIAHRHDPLFQEIQTYLLRSYPTFARLWQSLEYRLATKDASGYLRTFKHKHPQLGLLQYIVMSSPVYGGEREIFLATLLPTDLRSFACFNELVEDKSSDLQNFASVFTSLEME